VRKQRLPTLHFCHQQSVGEVESRLFFCPQTMVRRSSKYIKSGNKAGDRGATRANKFHGRLRARSVRPEAVHLLLQNGKLLTQVYCLCNMLSISI
jgi:hypothetical protein